MPETVDQQSHADEVDSTTTYCRGNVKQWPEEKAEQPSLENCVLLVDHTEFSCEEGDDGSTYNWSAFSAPVVASRIKNLAFDPIFREQVSTLPHYQVSHAKDVEELQIRMEDLMSRSEGGKKATADLIRLIREEYPEAAIYGDVDEETWHRVQNDGETHIYTAHYPIHGHSDDRDLYDLGPDMSPPTSHSVPDPSASARDDLEGPTPSPRSHDDPSSSEAVTHPFDSDVHSYGIKRQADGMGGGTESSESKRQHYY